MNIEALKRAETAIHDRIMKVRSPSGFLPIPDGLIDPADYAEANPKILIVLKEAHDSGDVRGGWYYRELFSQENIDRVINKSSATWHPLIYLMFAVTNPDVSWNDIPYVREKPDIKNLIRQTAIINLKKIPGGTRSTFKDIKSNLVTDWKDIVLDQIEVYKPEVILFGGTFSLLADFLPMTRDEMSIAGSCSFGSWRDRLIIDAYHPGQTKVTQEIYVSDILKVIQSALGAK